VISADDGKFFSQMTRGARLYLPEGLVGEMGQRLREKIAGGGYGNALVAAVRAFVDRVGEKNNFDFAALDPQRGEIQIAAQQRPRTVQSPVSATGENPAPTPTARSTPEAAATITPAAETSPEQKATVAPTPQPSETPVTAEPSPTIAATVTPTPGALPTETPSPVASPTLTPAEIPSPQASQPSPSASTEPTQPVAEVSPQPLKTPSPDRKVTAAPA